MTQLTEHAKTILRAIADGKELQVEIDDRWFPINTNDALISTQENGAKWLRITPETRNINGSEFPAPVDEGDYPLRLSSNNYSLISKWTFATAEGRNAAVVALINAMGGK